MGDCPDQDRVTTSCTVYSSSFKDYATTQGAHILYMYEFFLKHDMLSSASGDMPPAATFSSDSSPHAVAGGRPGRPQIN